MIIQMKATAQTLFDAARRAAASQRMRKPLRTEVAEDYGEFIGHLLAMTGEARLAAWGLT